MGVWWGEARKNSDVMPGSGPPGLQTSARSPEQSEVGAGWPGELS